MRGYLYRDLGECFYSPIQFKRVLDPAIVSAIIGAGASLASTAGSSIAAANLNADNRDFSREMTEKQNAFNAEQSAISREHQKGLLTQEQNWNEMMYNLYNSPSAMMRQYKEAGLNPYLVDAEGGHGTSLSSPTAPGSPQATGASVGSPSSFMPDMSGLSKAGEMFLMAKQVDANVANTSAKTLKEAAEAYSSLRGHGMSDDDAKSLIMPFFKGTQGMESNSDKFFGMLNLEYQAKAVSNKRSELAYELDKIYSAKERQSKLDETDQVISESIARIGKMASDAKLNEATIEHLAQDCVESLSRIYRNTAEGALAEEQGFQLLSLFPYIQSSAQIQGEKEEFDKETTFGNKGVQNFSKTFLGKGINLFLYYLGRAMNAGNIGINVGAKLGK